LYYGEQAILEKICLHAAKERKRTIMHSRIMRFSSRLMAFSHCVLENLREEQPRIADLRRVPARKNR
jgi:hypothetical protein